MLKRIRNTVINFLVHSAWYPVVQMITNYYYYYRILQWCETDSAQQDTN